MKKIFSLLFLLAFTICLVAQERTVDLNGGKILDLSKVKTIGFNGGTLERLLPTTRDTIDFTLKVANLGTAPMHFYAVITLDTIAGVDTTVAITVQGKNFANQAYSDIIASALTSVVSAEQLNVKTSLGVITDFTETTASATDILRQVTVGNSDTLTVAARSLTRLTNPVLYYSYLKFRLILKGNDSVGTGIKIKRIEINFF
jgi:hypothetical protein